MLRNLEDKYAQKKDELKTMIRDIEVCRYSRDISLENLTYANDDYQEALRALEEAKQLANDKLERLHAISERVKDMSTEYSTLIKKKAIVSDEILDIRLKRDNLILKQNLDETIREEKQTKKLDKMKINKQSLLLKKIQKMPYDVMLIIRSYLSYDVRVALIEDKFSSIMAKCKGTYAPSMYVAFLNFTATCPEILYLLSRKEARHQIPSLTPRGYHWRHLTYCLSPKNGKPLSQIIKNRILWLSKLAVKYNPELAYKIMKTIIVFGDNNKFRVSNTVSSKRYLTIEDLPSSYR